MIKTKRIELYGTISFENHLIFKNDETLFICQDFTDIMKFNFSEEKFTTLKYVRDIKENIELFVENIFFSEKTNSLLLVTSKDTGELPPIDLYELSLETNELKKVFHFSEDLKLNNFKYLKASNSIIFQSNPYPYKIFKFDVEKREVKQILEDVNTDLEDTNYKGKDVFIIPDKEDFVRIYSSLDFTLVDKFRFPISLGSLHSLYFQDKLFMLYSSDFPKCYTSIYDLKTKRTVGFDSPDYYSFGGMSLYNENSFITEGLNKEEVSEIRIWDSSFSCIKKYTFEEGIFNVIFPNEMNFKRFIAYPNTSSRDYFLLCELD